jgi:hypothetical protein
MRILCERKAFACEPLDTRTSQRQLAAEASERRATYQPVVTRRSRNVRVLVAVLIGLVVVLAILTELCLLQAAAMRRKVRAALPPEEDERR